jgi:hypothetical protein
MPRNPGRAVGTVTIRFGSVSSSGIIRDRSKKNSLPAYFDGTDVQHTYGVLRLCSDFFTNFLPECFVKN